MIPYRLDLAGGWLDQPFVNKHCAGSVITISLEPTIKFNLRSGMATSTRKKAIELWGDNIPKGDLETLANILFVVENPVDNKYLSGSQDAYGIVYPGINKLFYKENTLYPSKIESILDEEHISWLESHLSLVELSVREKDFDVLQNTNVNEKDTIFLSHASVVVWKAIQYMDLELLGRNMTRSFEQQIAMFPNMINEEIKMVIDRYTTIKFLGRRIETAMLGYKLSGAGGGGYLVLVQDKPTGIPIKIRRG